MKYNFLPGTGLQVSLISLGTMTFGGQTNEADSLAIMDYAFENGINIFDTADIYNSGISETIVGKGLKGRRGDIILSTKVNGPMSDNPNDRGLSRRHILSAVDASLKRLDTDYIDIYYMHAPDYNTDLEETLDTMSTLVRAGKVRYIGVSNFAAWQIADILAICDKRSYVSPVITQNVYNAITRGIEAELIPFLGAHHMGLTVYNPIAGGLLAGKHRAGSPAENTRFSINKAYYDRYWSEENFAALDDLTALSKDQGIGILELAMKWCAAQPRVTTIISGVSRLDQLKENIKSLEGKPLSPETLAACDGVWRSLAGTRFAYNR